MTVEELNKKGLAEALSALALIHKDISNAEKKCEQRMSESEAELNSLRRLRGFVDLEVEIHRARLRALEAREKPENPG